MATRYPPEAIGDVGPMAFLRLLLGRNPEPPHVAEARRQREAVRCERERARSVVGRWAREEPRLRDRFGLNPMRTAYEDLWGREDEGR